MFYSYTVLLNDFTIYPITIISSDFYIVPHVFQGFSTYSRTAWPILSFIRKNDCIWTEKTYFSHSPTFRNQKDLSLETFLTTLLELHIAFNAAEVLHPSTMALRFLYVEERHFVEKVGFPGKSNISDVPY